MAHNENEVTRLSNDVFTMDKILLGDVFIRGGSSSGTHVLEEGRPIGQFYGLVCNGIDENGRYIMVDKDGDGEISDPADYDYIGSAQPKLTYGITNTIDLYVKRNSKILQLLLRERFFYASRQLDFRL